MRARRATEGRARRHAAGMGLVGLGIVLALTAACREPKKHCDAASLREALASASAGDTVRVGTCRIEGSFEVPAGVRLVGEGPDSSVIATPEDVVGLRAFAQGSEIANLTIESSSIAGVLARGSGEMRLTRVTVDARAGVAVAFDGVDAVRMQEVTAKGVVTADNATDEAFFRVRSRAALLEGETCDPPDMPACDEGDRRTVACPGCGELTQVCPCGDWESVVATYGIALLGVEEATLEDVSVSGMAEVGVAMMDTTSDGTVVPGHITWRRGEIADNLRIGLYSRGGLAIELEDVGVLRTFEGISGFPPAYAGLLLGDPEDGTRRLDIRTTDATVSNNRSYGFVHRRATGFHRGLDAHDNGAAAVWLSEVRGMEIDGCSLEGNQFAGVVMADSSDISVSNTTVARTELLTRAVGATGILEVGDGIHMSKTLAGVSFESVELLENARAGLLVDLDGGSGDPLSFTDVTVDGSGGQYGAVAGDTMMVSELVAVDPDMWNDDGIMRLGATDANDAMAAGESFDFAGDAAPALPDPPLIVSPCD